jgi:GNAT superfamily N-acetyltransferase
MPPIEEFQVNLVVAIIIGVLSFCWALVTRRVRRYTFQRKFRVAGAYLSYFEDVQDGRGVWVKAPLRIRQRGADVTADGLDLLKGRNTDTRAKVAPDGSIFGTYGRLNPNDPAKGVVFLEPDPVSPGLYRGFYAGYDSTLRRLVSGRYVWRRLLRPRIAVVTARMPEGNTCRAVLGEFLGSRYAAGATFDEALSEAAGKVVLGAWVDGRVVGALLLDAQPVIDLSALDRTTRSDEQKGNLALHRTGTILAVAVLEDARGQGVATDLIRAATDLLRRRSCTAILTVVWRAAGPDGDGGIRDDVFTDVAPRGVDWAGAAPAADSDGRIRPSDRAGRLFRTEGFRLLGRLVNVPPPPGGCSDCAEPCRCEGWVYVRGLTRDTPHATLLTMKTSTG